MSSDFNVSNPFVSQQEIEIKLPGNGGRYEYYKTRRNGMLQFVKKISPPFSEDLQTMAALQKEFYICFPLSHPNIARYTALESDAIYSEFIEGKTLQEMLESGDSRLNDPKFIRHLIGQLFETLDYIHRQGVRHLDLKPENLMVTDKGNNLKVIDFGCAQSDSYDSTPGFTREHMAPEQAKGKADNTTDIFLAGKIVERLTRRLPGHRKWRKFIDKATATEPAARIASASEALEAMPDDSKFKLWQFMVVASLILIIAAAVLLLNPSGRNIDNNSEHKNDTIEVVSQVAQTAPKLEETIEKNEGDAVTNTGSTNNNLNSGDWSAPREENVVRNLERRIKEMYKKRLGPVVDDKEKYPEGRNSPGGDEAFRNALLSVQREAQDYGESLGRQHPDQKNEIDECVVSTITSLNILYMRRFNFQ